MPNTESSNFQIFRFICLSVDRDHTSTECLFRHTDTSTHTHMHPAAMCRDGLEPYRYHCYL